MKIFDWSKNVSKKELEEVISALNANELVVFPTETVYGLGGNALSDVAVDKIYRAKKRDYSKPISLLLPNSKAIEKIAFVSDEERKIIDCFMPGALTLILKKKDNISNLVTAKSNTVGVRIPNHEIALLILKELNCPLATSSANLAGDVNESDINQIIAKLKDDVAIFIKGDISNDLIASTVVALEKSEVKIIREGNITKSDIIKVL